jgi:putative peptidoglycan lipid II flippase
MNADELRSHQKPMWGRRFRLPTAGTELAGQSLPHIVMPPPTGEHQRVARGGNRHAFLVGAGIFLSKIFGLVRSQFFAHYFGVKTEAADAFNGAIRIPNFLQNLFGEGVLSASFIPVYSRLLAEKDEGEAGRVAGAVAALLALTVSVVVLLGVLATPYVIDLIVPGFHGAKRELCIRLTRILFLSAGFMVLSAWCLGILNSHRKFFLSYTAPVIWNIAMIVTMVAFGRRMDLSSLAVALAWGSVAGSALMVVVQVPIVLRLARRMSVGMTRNVREVVRNFAPVFVSRGVVQISAYVDMWLASFLSDGAVTGLTYAQNLYILPVSLFGMSVSAAELPEMSSALGDHGYLNQRLNNGLRQIAFFIVPSAMGFLALGNVIAAGLFQSGHFSRADSQYVWAILAGSAVGLLAQTLGRLYSSTYYALRDTRTPLRFALVRVVLTTGLGYVCALRLPGWIGIDREWGVAGLTASAGIAGWVEFVLLRRALNRRIGQTGLPVSLVARLWTAAGVAAIAGWAVKYEFPGHGPRLTAVAVLGAYGVVYFAMTYLLRVEECRRTLGRLRL